MQPAGAPPGPQADATRARSSLTVTTSMSARPLPATCRAHFPCLQGCQSRWRGTPLRGERPSSTLVSPLKALFPVWPPSACERGLGEGARATSGNMTCARNGGGGPPSSESADLCPVVGATALRRRQLLKRLFLLRPNSSRLYPPPQGPRAALPFDSGVSGRF